MTTIEEIRERRAAVARGPWRWHGYKNGTIDLVTAHSGMKIILSTYRAEPCDLWWELGESDRMCTTCRTWYELREIVQDAEDATGSICNHGDADACLDDWSHDKDGPLPCPPCKKYLEAADQWDRESGPKCENPRNWGTLWVGDPEVGFMEPINKYATKERDYRDDVNPTIDHPTAEFIRRSPEDIDVLLADIERLEGILHAMWPYTLDRSPAVRDMTTEQKDRYADAVEAASKRLNAGPTCECGCRDGATFDRWWRTDG